MFLLTSDGSGMSGTRKLSFVVCETQSIKLNKSIFLHNYWFFYAIMLFQLTQILGRTQPITTFDIWWSGYGSIYHQLCMYGILRFILLPARIPWFICSQTWFYILHKYISSIYFFEKYIKPPKLYLYFFISSNHVI